MLYTAKAWNTPRKDEAPRKYPFTRYDILPKIDKEYFKWRMRCNDAAKGDAMQAKRMFEEFTMLEVEEALLLLQATSFY